jgi:hypothetical protein
LALGAVDVGGKGYPCEEAGVASGDAWETILAHWGDFNSGPSMVAGGRRKATKEGRRVRQTMRAKTRPGATHIGMTQ